MRDILINARKKAIKEYSHFNGVTVKVDFDKPLSKKDLDNIRKNILICSNLSKMEFDEIIELKSEYIILKFKLFKELYELVDLLKESQRYHMKYPEYYVFDEKKSVEWNKQKVKKYNKAIQQEELAMRDMEYDNVVIKMIYNFTINEFRKGVLANTSDEFMETMYKNALQLTLNSNSNECSYYTIFSYMDMLSNMITELMNKANN